MFDDAWFPALPAPADPRLRLFLLPFAGGGAGIYATWPQALPADVHVIPVQLPGRERRLRDRPYSAMAPLVRDLFGAMAPALDRPWAVFGHSMGAAIAYELARAGAAAGQPPAHLFVSARRAPGLPPPHPPMFALPEDRLVAETERLYGPLPDVLKRHPGILRTFLPTMRADYQLLDTWVAPTDQVLSCPVTVYGGEDDGAVPPSSLAPWEAVTRGPTRVVVMPGGHFTYVRDAHDARDDVAAVLAGAGDARS
ncbi:MAG: thioesterase [Alphaproteobacteria bacterium]|nr:thioesterase [Alphaproteobacteria bacterium]